MPAIAPRPRNTGHLTPTRTAPATPECGALSRACAAIVAGLRRAGYSEDAALEQARRFHDRVAAEQVYDATLARVVEAVR